MPRCEPTNEARVEAKFTLIIPSKEEETKVVRRENCKLTDAFIAFSDLKVPRRRLPWGLGGKITRYKRQGTSICTAKSAY